MSIGSTQQLTDSCAKITQSSTASCDCRSSFNGNCLCLSQLESNRKIRREIANSNERKRMECINTGFQALKMLLPHKENEKLSKAMILQQTAQYILSLEQDKTTLLQQNTSLKRLLASCECQNMVDERPPAKRQRCESHSNLSGKETKITSNNINGVYYSVQDNELKDVKITHSQCEREQNLHMLIKDQDLGGKITDILEEEKPKSGQNLDSIVLAIKHLEDGDTDGIETPTKQNLIFSLTNVHKSSKRIII